MPDKKRSTFIPATRSKHNHATLAEAYERQSHVSAAEEYWREGQQVIAAERLAADILAEQKKPTRGRNQ